MKKLILTTITGLSLILTPNLYAGGLWSMAKNAGLPTKQPKTFAIEVEGVNIRAYVFDVPEMKSICISVWGTDTQQLECKTYNEIGVK